MQFGVRANPERHDNIDYDNDNDNDNGAKGIQSFRLPTRGPHSGPYGLAPRPSSPLCGPTTSRRGRRLEPMPRLADGAESA